MKQIDEINQLFQDYQDELTTREKHLKLIPDFSHSMDELTEFLRSKDIPTPDLLNNSM